MWRLAYRLIRAVSSVQFFIARRSSRAGLFVLGGIIMSGALGIDTTQTTAYQAFTFLFALAGHSSATATFQNTFPVDS